MSRERWGTFSVADHLRPQAFVADVLLYDRLIIPEPVDAAERTRWDGMGWAPDELDVRLGILGDLVCRVPWDRRHSDQLKRYAMADIAARDASDWYHATRMLLTEDLLPVLPEGVAKVWPIAAYSSFDDYAQDIAGASENERRQHLGMVMKHRFLVPNTPGASDLDLLTTAVGLARRDDFKERRAAFNKWQEDVIEQDIPVDKAIQEMDQLLKNYNDTVRKATKSVYWKFAFTLIPTALTVAAGAGLAPLTAVGALSALYRFAKYDKQPTINAGEAQAAAMLHDVREDLKWH
ncbi:MAG: hypothetical protein P4L92_00055 [Rudaea sp.]|nr:hypothetical protein [Rudaea sp.]